MTGTLASGKFHGDQQFARRLMGLSGNHKAQRGKGDSEKFLHGEATSTI